MKAIFVLLMALAVETAWAESGPVSLEGRFWAVADPGGALTIDDFVGPSAETDRFERVAGDHLNLGYTNDPVWVRLDLPGTEGEPWLVQLDYPLLDNIQAYFLDGYGSWRYQELGDRLPFGARPYSHRTFVIPLEETDSSVLLLRIQSESSMQIRPLAWKADAFYRQQLKHELFFGVIYGIVALMALYNAFLFLAVRDKTYLAYIFSVLSGGVFIMGLNGHAYQYLWPASPTLANTSITLSSSLWVLTTTLFAQLFLELRRNARVFWQLTNGVVVLALVSCGLALFAPYGMAIQFGTGLAAIAALLILSAAIESWRRGHRAARFFTAAWVVYATGTFMLIISRFGVLPDNFLTHHSATLGIVLEIVILSLALSDKYRVLNSELETYAHNLEFMVEERTTELEHANERLRVLSEQDPLTGLPNRRVFDRTLKTEWQRHLRSGNCLSLLVCDVDQFKSLNDSFGHDRGDECLQAVAEALQSQLRRPADRPARLGGDEFAVILPDTTIRGAMEVADKICAAVADREMTHSPNARLPVVSLSVGVAGVVPSEDAASSQLYRLADRGLYQAKQDGMNQVAVARPENQADDA